MTLTQMRADFLAMTRRPLTLALLVGVFVLCAVDAAQPLGRPPLGILGTLTLNTDGTITYGLAGALLVSALLLSGANDLADVWHARGVGAFERLTHALLYAIPIAVAVRVVAILGIVAGGAFDGLRRGWRWDSLVSTTFGHLASAQLRLLLAYIAASALGAALALAANNQAATAAIVLAGTGVYTPFVGGLANRAGPLLDLLPWAPFGALRATLSGNGAIFGTDPTQWRIVDTPPAALTLVGWFAVTIAWYFLRPSLQASDRSVLMYAVPIPTAIAVTCVAALAFPTAMDGHVPWRWSPQWRHAKADGLDSRQVTLRWAELASKEDPQAKDLLVAAARGQIGEDIATVLRDADRISVAPESQMLSPEYTRLIVTFKPARRSGNVTIDRAELQLHLASTGKTWRITQVQGPFVRVQATPQ